MYVFLFGIYITITYKFISYALNMLVSQQMKNKVFLNTYDVDITNYALIIITKIRKKFIKKKQSWFFLQ